MGAQAARKRGSTRRCHARAWPSSSCQPSVSRRDSRPSAAADAVVLPAEGAPDELVLSVLEQGDGDVVE